MYQTVSSSVNTIMYTNFGCRSSNFFFNDCRNPSGISQTLSYCSMETVGLQCIGMLSY